MLSTMKGFHIVMIEVTPLSSLDEMNGRLPEAEFPVSRSIGVPIGQWHHPSFQPRSLDDIPSE